MKTNIENHKVGLISLTTCCSDRPHPPTVLFHLLTAKLWLQVMVMTAEVGTAGWVLADTCVTGELDRNFMIIHTSSCTVVNIMGDWNTYMSCIHSVYVVL